MTYKEKLLDPRWQKKRLEVLDRDNFTCQDCLSTQKTLHVHHLDYVGGIEPWDYPDHYLLTLCVDCHQTVTKNRKANEDIIIKCLRLSIHDSFIWRCVTDVLAQYSDLHRMFFLLWELEEKKVLQVLEASLLEKKQDSMVQYLQDVGEPPICIACGGEFKFLEKYNYHQCATCGFTHPYAKNTNS